MKVKGKTKKNLPKNGRDHIFCLRRWVDPQSKHSSSLCRSIPRQAKSRRIHSWPNFHLEPCLQQAPPALRPAASALALRQSTHELERRQQERMPRLRDREALRRSAPGNQVSCLASILLLTRSTHDPGPLVIHPLIHQSIHPSISPSNSQLFAQNHPTP